MKDISKVMVIAGLGVCLTIGGCSTCREFKKIRKEGISDYMLHQSLEKPYNSTMPLLISEYKQ